MIISKTEYTDVLDAVVRPSSEAELASSAMERGKKVIHHAGTYWIETRPGFYEPMHWFARLRNEQIERPCFLCWGYRSTLHKDAAAHANGSLPLHLLGENDLFHYDEAYLPTKRRSQLRKARKVVQVVRVIDPTQFLEQGYDVLKSAVTRTRHGLIPTYYDYCRSMNKQVQGKSLLLAGLVDEIMRGYFIISAVNDVAYIDTVLLATEFLSTDIGTALVFEAVQVARRCPQIKYVVYGLHSIEDPRLGVFKEGMGFKVHLWPLKYQIPGVVNRLIGWRSPGKLYRLTGKSNSRLSG